MSGSGRVPRCLVIGQKVGILTVKEALPKRGNWSYYLMLCECGKEISARIDTLKDGDKTRSCGCLAKIALGKSKYKHGGCIGNKNSKLYGAWNTMMSRCYNVKSAMYRCYGARGIEVCDRWRDGVTGFLNFSKDLGEPPSASHSLDRIDVNSNYSPENCRWATSKEQARNKQNTLHVSYEGQIKCLSEWCEIFNLDYYSTRYKLKTGSRRLEDIVSTADKPRLNEVDFV